MKIHPAIQGTPEWIQARLGIPTASCFSEIITPKEWKASKSQDAYRARLVAEWFTGQPIDDHQSQYMQRGTELEAEAVADYEFASGYDTVQVGLCLRDDEKVGASPDRLVGDDGLLEIKCPALHTHVGYLLKPSTLVETYWCQLQGELYITGRRWADVMSYNPILPRVKLRVTRDDGFILKLDDEINKFLERLESAKGQLNHLRQEQRPKETVERDPDPFALNEPTQTMEFKP